MALTKDAIWKVADELDAEGTKPTLAAVRKRLGGVGSFTTIQDVMSEWKQHKQQTSTPAIEPAPAALSEAVNAMASDIWNLARASAEQALESERQVLADEAAQLREQAAEAIALADSMNEELERLRAQVVELGELKSNLRELQANFRALEERSVIELKHASDKAATALQERKEAQEKTSATEIRAARAEGQIEALQSQIDKLVAAQKPSKTTNPK
ncbi:DNA-binding protein (plasmid) [Pseudomonas viciae]|uniref:DNA-binding protein n=1 Tax=Pseudomonas viciae TaxID=2505979 RepID=A0ABY8PMG9_9PSED|nr:DNA-binding protein [Pseudomonas viciae]WGO96413.1 DNA-binding protein [Pseudomonas viciae]